MNATIETPPTLPHETANAPGAWIYLQLSIPSIPAALVIFPENNFGGTGILADLLAAKLEAAGQLAARQNFAGPLNCAIMVFSVRDAKAAARIILESLERHHLAHFAELFRYDGQEDVLRRFYPAGAPDTLREHLEAKIADFEKMLRLRLAGLMPPPDQHP